MAMMEHIEKSNPYFDLFHGLQVPKSQILDKVPYTMPAIELLLREGHLIGQFTLFDDDEILWLADKAKEAEMLDLVWDDAKVDGKRLWDDWQEL